MAFHFRIEGDQLSGYALLRSQELSLFSVVNYLEIRSLVDDLIAALKDDFPNLQRGRIAMLSTLAYFDPHSRLLMKPKLCRMTYDAVRQLAKPGNIRELTDDLDDFASHHCLRIETDWCDDLANNLPTGPAKAAAEKLKETLVSLGARKGETGTVLVEAKKQAVSTFLDELRKSR